MSRKVRSSAVTPRLQGEPLEGRARDIALLFLGVALIFRDLDWTIQDEASKVRRTLRLDEIEADHETITVQNIGGAPDSLRGLVGALASIVSGRRESERRARHNADPAVRAQKEREREARERAGEEATRHLRESTENTP